MRVRSWFAATGILSMALVGCGDSGEMAPGMPANAKIGEDVMPKTGFEMSPKDQAKGRKISDAAAKLPPPAPPAESK